MELNEETKFILGRPNFWCGGIARLLRKRGYDIPLKSEDEQAYVIHWMLCLYEEHGSEFWGEKAREILFKDAGVEVVE